MSDPLLTPKARGYVRRLAQTLLPHADTLDRRFRGTLRAHGYDALQVRAFLAITPAAASRHRSLNSFLEQVRYNGRRLAKLNVQPAAAIDALQDFGRLLQPLLGDQFQPAREQLHLATTLALNDAFYQVREAEAQAFFGLERAAAQAADLEDLLRRFVRVLTRTFHARSGRLQLLTEPPAGKLARPRFIEKDTPDEDLIADPFLRGQHRSYWSFPILPSALLQFGFDTSYPWLPRELTLLNAVSERCREAIDRARLQEENRALEAQARRAEEEERRRIGRELHDEAGQSLLLLRLQLEMMERASPEPLRPAIREARETAERTIEEVRRLVAALSPALLERLGLETALRQLAARFRRIDPAQVRIRLSGSGNGLSKHVQEVIYRVAQESLQNIAKHSEATRVNLFLRKTDMSIRLSVADNGAGFSADSASSKPMSFGLAGMRERAALLGGTLAVQSAPGNGAKVTVDLPITSAVVTHHG